MRNHVRVDKFGFNSKTESKDGVTRDMIKNENDLVIEWV